MPTIPRLPPSRSWSKNALLTDKLVGQIHVGNNRESIMLDGSTVLVTGGTGSFGSTFVKRLLQDDVGEVRIFSRDEAKQDQMRISLGDSRVRFYLGDVRDRDSVRRAVKGSDYVFHAAALKQVPSCEFFPLEAVATNIHGSSNVVQSSIESEVKSVVCLSTDKAVYPINAMGMSKALMEKTALSFARNAESEGTRICVTRYGNVMYSRGSVLPLFVSQIHQNKPVTVTNPSMTRFLMSLADSVDLVLHAFHGGQTGDLFVRKSPAATIQTIVEAMGKIFDRDITIKTIGVRHGEKAHETLLAEEERRVSIDQGQYFRVPLDSRTLDYGIYVETGMSEVTNPIAFTSANTEQLDTDGVVSLLMTLPEIQELLEESK